MQKRFLGKKAASGFLIAVLIGFGTWTGLQSLGIAHAQGNTNPHAVLDSGLPYVPGEVVVKYKHGVTATAISTLHRVLGLTQKHFVNALGLESATLPSGKHVHAMIQQLKQEKIVAYAEPNYIIHASSVGYTPNDPYFSQPYNTSQNGAISQWAPQKINAPQAWSTFRGPGSTVIAVLDTGVDSTHPDLAGRVLPGYNFVDNNSNTQDTNGHGTNVAGIAAAVSDNNTGIASVSFNSAEILPVKVLDQQGNGTSVAVADGITYAVDHGAKVINMSLGDPNYSQAIQDAINYAWSKGIVVVAAAGNGGNSTPQYPAADSYVVGVTATNQQDQTVSFDTYGNEVSLSAPGVAILSTMPTYPVYLTQVDGYKENYDAMTGTSMAAPEVSGLAALLIAQHQGNLSATSVIQNLERSADPIGTTHPANAQGGWDPYHGYGRIDAANAVNGVYRSAAVGGIRGQVVDGSGNPIAGAVVSAGGESVTTGQDGMYRLANLPVSGSPYSVTVQSGGATYQSTPVQIVGGADTFLDVNASQSGPMMGNYPSTIQSGGFEDGGFNHWTTGGGAPTPTISTAQVHSGSYSALLGVSSGSEPVGNSSLYQTVHVQIPQENTKATLSFWYWPATTDTVQFDWQECQIRDTNGNVLATVMKQASDAMGWQQVTYDLTPYNGQNIQIYFNVHEDGAGDPTWMYLDDVSVSYS